MELDEHVAYIQIQRGNVFSKKIASKHMPIMMEKNNTSKTE